MTRRTAILALALSAALPAAARAQQADYGLRPDSAGIPADTVRLAARRVAALEGCRVIGLRVVDDSAAAAYLRRWPQCASADFGSLAERTLVGVPLFSDCHARYRVDAWRSASRREYRIATTDYYGGCRAARGHYVWIALPRLPPGWTVSFTEIRQDRDVDGDLPLFPSRIHIPGDTVPDAGGDDGRD